MRLPSLCLLLALLAGCEGDVIEPPDSGLDLTEELRTDELRTDAPDDAALLGEPDAPDDGTAGFAVRVRDDVIPYEVFGVYVMPGEALDLEAVFTHGKRSVALDAEAGTVTAQDAGAWTWKAPAEPGLVRLTVTDAPPGAPPSDAGASEADASTIRLNAFVLTPFDHRSETLNGYRIGDYADTPMNGDPVYDEPPGFIELNAATADARVSPHFTLAQFACKQGSGYPKYLLLRERLLLKLERVLDEVRAAGIEAPTLTVLSGYRTPHYNKVIGNTTVYSRHLYGGAADVYVDADGDDYMDDLDGDGAVSTDEARLLAAIVEAQRDEPWYAPLVGGLGVYSPAPHRGPFIHVDVRGTPARW